MRAARFEPPRPMSMTLNLAPMVDVMMCLIIFFLVGSRLASEQALPLLLSVSETARRASDETMGARVTVNVRPSLDASAEYVVTGWDGHGFSVRRISPEALSSVLVARASGRDVNDLTCVIRVDRRVHYGDVERVLRACGDAGIGKVVFGAEIESEDES